MRRLLLLPLLAGLPFVVAAVGMASLADMAGQRAGARLAALVPARTAPAPAPVALLPLAAPEPGDETPANTRAKPTWGRAAAAAPVPERGLRVGAAKVLSLARAGVRPSGVPVPAEGARPAGLLLSGVSGLGVGLCDGDVLTHAAGRPARSAGEVISLVIASRGARVPEISGRFWRNGQPYTLVVEQPYVKRKASEPARDEPAAVKGASESSAGATAREAVKGASESSAGATAREDATERNSRG